MENISYNLLITAINSNNKEMNNVKNQDTGNYGGVNWVVFGDENYGHVNTLLWSQDSLEEEPPLSSHLSGMQDDFMINNIPCVLLSDQKA